MKFFIDDQVGSSFESFETAGHDDNNLSAHLDAMKVAHAWGYSDTCAGEFFLITEDGFIYQVVDPYRDGFFLEIMTNEIREVA